VLESPDRGTAGVASTGVISMLKSDGFYCWNGLETLRKHFKSGWNYTDWTFSHRDMLYGVLLGYSYVDRSVSFGPIGTKFEL
jgi:hypothetical protein